MQGGRGQGAGRRQPRHALHLLAGGGGDPGHGVAARVVSVGGCHQGGATVAAAPDGEGEEERDLGAGEAAADLELGAGVAPHRDIHLGRVCNMVTVTGGSQEGIYYKWASVKMTLEFHFLWSTLF